MKNSNAKWLLAAVVAVCCLAPAAVADRDRGRGGDKCDPRWQKCVQAPEGGSTAIYLLGVGLTCAGAMFFRSKLAKRTQS